LVDRVVARTRVADSKDSQQQQDEADRGQDVTRRQTQDACDWNLIPKEEEPVPACRFQVTAARPQLGTDFAGHRHRVPVRKEDCEVHRRTGCNQGNGPRRLTQKDKGDREGTEKEQQRDPPGRQDSTPSE
jgi:hypothetical protein